MPRLLLLFFFMLPAYAHTATILVFGDSLSAAYGLRTEEGWVARLQAAHPQHTWINASVSGETTQGGLARLPPLLQKHQPDILVIELGANDGLRGQPPAHIESNLDQMIRQGKAAGAAILLLGIRVPPNYGPRYAQAVANLYPALASRHNIAVVPFFLEAIAHDNIHFQPDQLHPTAAAQPAIARTVWPVLDTVLQGLPAGSGAP